MRTLAIAIVVFLLLLSGVPQASPRPVPKPHAQSNPSTPTIPGTDETGAPQQVSPDVQKTIDDVQRKQIKERAVQRFASLKKDTDQLLQLATELKNEVDKASPQMLSVNVIKKTEQIEDLSKKIRKKMTTTECVSSEPICKTE